jgi:hypothetical protein
MIVSSTGSTEIPPGRTVSQLGQCKQACNREGVVGIVLLSRIERLRTQSPVQRLKKRVMKMTMMKKKEGRSGLAGKTAIPPRVIVADS